MQLLQSPNLLSVLSCVCRLELAARIASGAAYVTGTLAKWMGDAAYYAAHAICKAMPGSSRSRPAGSSGTGHPGATATEEVTPGERSVMKTIGAAGLLAYVDVYDSLESAAKLVLLKSGTASQSYIGYK